MLMAMVIFHEPATVFPEAIAPVSALVCRLDSAALHRMAAKQPV